MTKHQHTKRPGGTIVALTKALNITPSHVHRLLRGGMPDDPAGAAAWREKRTQGDDSVAELRRQRIALVKSQREKIDQENRHRCGELILRSEVFESSFRNFSEARGELLKMASELPPRLAGLQAAAIYKVLRAEIVSTLRRLSEGLAKDNIADAENLTI